MRINSSAIIVFALLVGATGVGAQQTTAASKQAAAATDTAIVSAQRAANAWLAQLDGAQYGPSWDSAAQAFQQATTRDRWIATVQKVRGQVGPLGTRSLTHSQFTTSLPNVPAGEYVVLQYRTESGSGGFVTETVTMGRDGARGWRVMGYFVRPA
jgi:hypothetical protein